jgi:hypothetical protein
MVVAGSHSAALGLALDYIMRGWRPVPVAFRSKRPTGGYGWHLIHIDASNAAQFFNGDDQNVGIQMGPASQGLTDGDMDTEEARTIAPYFMPRTKSKFGRASARWSHYLYYSDLADNTGIGGAVHFKDPTTKEMILELRIGGDGRGAQTVAPGSVHEDTGEQIVWDEDGEPTRIAGDDLLRCAKITAALALLARHWPLPGSKARHSTALRLGGFLARCGWNETQIMLALEAITKAANDEESWDRKAAGRDALRHFSSGGNAAGFPALREDFGEPIARRVAEWLDYQPGRIEDDLRAAGNDKDGDGRALSVLDVFDAGDDIKLPDPRGWLVANQFCRRFLSSLVAPGAVGKTALRVAQFISVATGRAFLGQHVFMRCRVLLLSFEDGRDELRRRIAACCMHHGVGRSELKGWLYYAAPKGIKLAELKDGSPACGELEKQLRTKIRELKPDIVSLDPFVKTHALEENDSGAMDFVCGLMATLAEEFDIAVDAPHHARKGIAAPGDADTGRGSSSIKDAGRLVFTLTPMSEDEARQFSIDQADRRQFVRLDSAKVNLTPPAKTATWFRLVSVPIGNSTPDYPAGDHVQTVKPWTPPDTWAGLPSIALNAALTEIDTGMPKGQRYSDSATASAAKAAWRVVQKHCPDRSEPQCKEIIAAWVRNGVLYGESYDDPIARKPRQGLRLDPAKRPS